MTPDDLTNPSVSWQAKIATWLANQGTSTVLLFAILWGINQQAPKMIEAVNRGYEVNAQKLEKAADTYERTTETLLQQMRDDRQMLIELIKKNADKS